MAEPDNASPRSERQAVFEKLPRTRREAQTIGASHYFTGIPCKRRHLVPRLANGHCPDCLREYASEWYQADKRANQDKYDKKNKEFHAKHKAKRNASCREYYKKNKKHILARKYSIRCADPDTARAKEAAKRARNPGAYRAADRRFSKKHPEHNRVKLENRRARKERSSGRYTAKQIRGLYARQKGLCAHSWCKARLKKGYHIDHRVPLANGGSNDIRNIQLLCVPCNLKKSAKDPIRFAQENGLLL